MLVQIQLQDRGAVITERRVRFDNEAEASRVYDALDALLMPPASTEAAPVSLAHALGVMVLDHRTREWLAANDPKALEQAIDALTSYEPAYAARLAEAKLIYVETTPVPTPFVAALKMARAYLVGGPAPSYGTVLSAMTEALQQADPDTCACCGKPLAVCRAEQADIIAHYHDQEPGQ